MDKIKTEPLKNKDRSNKSCCCGGHNLGNPKKYLSHNSTKNKLNVRKERRFKLFSGQRSMTEKESKIYNKNLKKMSSKNIDSEIVSIVNTSFWDLLL